MHRSSSAPSHHNPTLLYLRRKPPTGATTDLHEFPTAHEHGCPPVADWLTDFDHQHPDYAAAAPEIWEQVRTSGCPIAHSDRHGTGSNPPRGHRCDQ